MTHPQTPPAARAPLVRVTRKSPCPVCRKPDNCAVSADGRVAYCRRKPSDRRGRDGGWTHFLDGRGLEPRRAPEPEPPARDRAPADTCDHVYRAMLSALTLSVAHADHLLGARGLSHEAVERNLYVSCPAPADMHRLCAGLSHRFDLTGVPGFFRSRQGEWKLTTCAPGILIPVRDHEGRVSALQLRRDEGEPRYLLLSSSRHEGGASSSAPVHFANVWALEKTGRAVITEGALKGDIVANHLQACVVAIAGVSTFREGFGAELRRRLPRLRVADVCFDADWRTNPHVKSALFRLLRELSSARIAASVRTWPARHKGFDDYLVEGRALIA
jgi:hypothetical protein